MYPTTVMEKLYTLILLLTAGASYAQHNYEFYVDSVELFVASGAEIHVNGDVHLMGTSTFTNNGLVRTQGNTFGSIDMQQRGTGTYRIENSTINTGEWQSLNGRLNVRGGQAQIGVDDGSFYDLELANDMGVVQVTGNSHTDVRNTVDFYAGSVHTRIVTANVPGAPLSPIYPANGADYPGLFGLMNPQQGGATLINSSVDIGGNSSAFDAGYIQGNFRRAVDPVGGVYGFVVGLEPAGAGSQRGFQYMQIDLGANNYDVITTYFQSAEDNTMTSQVECTSYLINYFGGWDSGQWVLSDINGTGTGPYRVQVWPQDTNLPGHTVWLITKDNAISGTANDCGPSYVGLDRDGYTSFNFGQSQFGVAASSSSILPVELTSIRADGMSDYIEVVWDVASEHNTSHYELERSEDAVSFQFIESIDAFGTTTEAQTYQYDDRAVSFFQDYYYRLKIVDNDGSYEYSPVVSARLNQEFDGFSDASLNVYPNPSSDQFLLMFGTEEERSLELTVTNALGQKVFIESMTVGTGNTLVKLAAEEWSPGVYQLFVVDLETNESIVKRLIKQ